MTGKSAYLENGFLALLFNATAFGSIMRDAASPLTNFYISLHSADPIAGDQTTNEIAYTTYARQAVARTSGGWTVSGNSVSPAANVVFPTPSAGSGTVTHIAIGTDLTGAGHLLYTGALTPNLTITVGSPPTLLTTSTIVET